MLASSAKEWREIGKKMGIRKEEKRRSRGGIRNGKGGVQDGTPVNSSCPQLIAAINVQAYRSLRRDGTNFGSSASLAVFRLSQLNEILRQRLGGRNIPFLCRSLYLCLLQDMQQDMRPMLY